MVKGIPLTQVGKLLSKVASKGNIASAVIGEGLEVGRTISKKTFGFDFVGLVTSIAVIYVVAWVIDIFMKAKLFFDNPAVQQSIIAGFFGLAGILFNIFAPKPEQSQTKITENKFINDLFSEEGFKGFKYWDIINILVMLIIVSTYFRLRADSAGADGKPSIQPATTAAFIILFLAVGIIEVSSLLPRLKKTDLGIEAFR